MKLVFKKDEARRISVFHEVDGKQRDFSYVNMIKTLLKSRKLDEPDISEGFTEAETTSIKSMVTRINKQLSAIDEPDVKSGS